MGAERLALELYGEFGKPVTARAELSRLRRALPGAIVANPYRLAIELRDDRAEVEELLAAGRLAEALDRYPGPLLPGSEAPLVVEARQRLDDGLREAILASGSSDCSRRGSEPFRRGRRRGLPGAGRPARRRRPAPARGDQPAPAAALARALKLATSVAKRGAFWNSIPCAAPT